MRRLLALAAMALPMVLVLAQPVSAQSTDDVLKERKAKKLKSPFLSKAKWFTDYKKALAEAEKSGKLVLGYFTRSYSP